MKNGTTVICTNIFKGNTEEEIKKGFNACLAKIVQNENISHLTSTATGSIDKNTKQ